MRLDQIDDVLVDAGRILNDIAFYACINAGLKDSEFAQIRLEKNDEKTKVFHGDLSISGIMEVIKDGEYKFISPNYIAFVTKKDNQYYINKMHGRQSDYQI